MLFTYALLSMVGHHGLSIVCHELKYIYVSPLLKELESKRVRQRSVCQHRENSIKSKKSESMVYKEIPYAV